MRRMVQVMIALCAVIAMLCIWPFSVITKTTEIGSGMGEAFLHTETIGPDSAILQFFCPSYDYIQQMSLAFSTDALLADASGNIQVELYAENDTLVFKTTIPVTEIKNHTYYVVDIEKRVKRRSNMYYRISVDESLAGQIAVDYNTTPENRMPEMVRLCSDTIEYDGASICLIGYRTGLGKKNVLLFWLSIILIAFAIETIIVPKEKEKQWNLVRSKP